MAQDSEARVTAFIIELRSADPVSDIWARIPKFDFLHTRSRATRAVPTADRFRGRTSPLWPRSFFFPLHLHALPPATHILWVLRGLAVVLPTES